MAGKVLNIKICSSLKLRSGLTGKKYTICHYPYNLPLYTSSEKPPHVQAHFILLVPHKIKRAFTAPPPPKLNSCLNAHLVRY